MTATILDTSTDLEEFVRLGTSVSLNWRVELPRDLDALRSVLDVAGPYNSFAPDEVYDLIGCYWEDIARFELAREGSMAVYATLPYHRHQTLAAKPVQGVWLDPRDTLITGDETRAIAELLMRDALSAGADEVSYEGHHTVYGANVASRVYGPTSDEFDRTIPTYHRPYTVRAWWD